MLASSSLRGLNTSRPIDITCSHLITQCHLPSIVGRGCGVVIGYEGPQETFLIALSGGRSTSPPSQLRCRLECRLSNDHSVVPLDIPTLFTLRCVEAIKSLFSFFMSGYFCFFGDSQVCASNPSTSCLENEILQDHHCSANWRAMLPAKLLRHHRQHCRTCTVLSLARHKLITSTAKW